MRYVDESKVRLGESLRYFKPRLDAHFNVIKNCGVVWCTWCITWHIATPSHRQSECIVFESPFRLTGYSARWRMNPTGGTGNYPTIKLPRCRTCGWAINPVLPHECGKLDIEFLRFTIRFYRKYGTTPVEVALTQMYVERHVLG